MNRDDLALAVERHAPRQAAACRAPDDH
jgi:hypothetical protein